MKRTAFTLIELLVVIAIIAILAAILFPVFAQAKNAAKDAVDLSNVKQMALANLMYTNDYDDSFVLAGACDPTETVIYMWQDLILPYTKSPAITLDVKLPAPIADTGGASTAENQLSRNSQFGMMPRAATQASWLSTPYFVWGTTPRTAKITGGLTPSFDGIAGTVDQPQDYYDNVPSLTVSQIPQPSGTYLLGQSNSWDFGTFWDVNPLFWFHFPTDPLQSGYEGYDASWDGPTAIKNPKNSVSMGWLSLATYNSLPGATSPVDADGISNGFNIHANVDGSAKATDVRGDVLKIVQISDGSFVLDKFWPNGR